jgi:hypothetical protein
MDKFSHGIPLSELQLKDREAKETASLRLAEGELPGPNAIKRIRPEPMGLVPSAAADNA